MGSNESCWCCWVCSGYGLAVRRCTRGLYEAALVACRRWFWDAGDFWATQRGQAVVSCDEGRAGADVGQRTGEGDLCGGRKAGARRRRRGFLGPSWASWARCRRSGGVTGRSRCSGRTWGASGSARLWSGRGHGCSGGRPASVLSGGVGCARRRR